MTPAPMPVLPRTYQHLLRGPRFAVWRAVLTPALAAAMLFASVTAIGMMALAMGMDPGFDAASDPAFMEPAPFLFINLVLAALMPCCMLATRFAHRFQGGVMSSVTGAFRWQWFLRCCAVLTPLYIAYLAVDFQLDPPDAPRPEQALLLLLLVILSTPWQAAGEEYLFRGLILQNVAACFSNARSGLIVASVLSVLLFAAAHGSTDVWIFMDLAISAAAWSYLAWRTGGLEAPIAMHALNNVIGMGSSVVFGGWGDGFVDETSQGQPLDPLLTLIVCSIAIWLVRRQADRHGIARWGNATPAVPAAQAGTAAAAP